MWIIQADTRNHTHSHRHTHTGSWIPGKLWLVYVLYIVYVKHTRTRNVLRFLKVLFASCSLQSISREMRVGECEWERERAAHRHQQQHRQRTLLVVVSFGFLSLFAPAKIACYLYQQQSGLRKIHTVWPHAANVQNTSSSYTKNTNAICRLFLHVINNRPLAITGAHI